MNDTNTASTQSIADYLAQLLKDRKQLAAFPNVFIHVERLLDEGKWCLSNLPEIGISRQTAISTGRKALRRVPRRLRFENVALTWLKITCDAIKKVTHGFFLNTLWPAFQPRIAVRLSYPVNYRGNCTVNILVASLYILRFYYLSWLHLFYPLRSDRIQRRGFTLAALECR